MASHDRSGRGSDSPIPLRFTFSQEILQIARRCADRIGLSADLRDDCAFAFVGRVLLDDKETGLRPPDQRHLTGTYCPAWVYRCALNHAIIYRRQRRNITNHERPWPELHDAIGDRAAAAFADNAPDPEAWLMRQASLRHIDESLEQLMSEPRAFFLRHHQDGESVRTIAADIGRTPHAIDQSLTRTRQRLRALLERRGVTEVDLRLEFASAPHARHVWREQLHESDDTEA